MTLDELTRIAAEHDRGIVLVGSRTLRRVIKAHLGIERLGLQVPHSHSYALRRDELAPIAAIADLPVDAATLPDEVLLLAVPHPRLLASQSPADCSLWLWRRCFHARVHLALHGRLRDDEITHRIDRVGQTEFDEVRGVLRQEDVLLPPADDRGVWEEFVALYLELRHFEPALLPRFFPSLTHRAAIDTLLAEDVDAAALFAGTRPPDAPDPAQPGQEPPQELPAALDVAVADLAEAARVAAAKGNVVRAAVLWSRGARSLQEASADARREALACLGALAQRLRTGLGGHGPTEAAWREALLPLLFRSDLGRFNAEVRLLYDLQKACTEAERELFKLEPWGWLRSWGRLPLRRALPAESLARAVKHLRRALQRGHDVEAALGGHGHALVVCLYEAVHAADHNLRARLRPLLGAALDEQPGLRPRSAAEEVARNKLMEELLDQISTRGFIHIGDLRDAISRNQLKLPDLGGPIKFIKGDELLCVDARLAIDLCGVYRRGEIYMRFLQRVSSLVFGTLVGRLLTRYAILPYGCAFVLLEGLQHIVGPLVRALSDYRIHLLSLPSFLALGTLLLGVFWVAPVRRALFEGLRWLWRLVRFFVYDLWRWFFRLGPVRRFLGSAAFQHARRLLLEPAAVGVVPFAIVHLCGAGLVWSSAAGGLGYLAVFLLLNTRAGRDVRELLLDAFARSWQELASHILPGIIAAILEAFRSMMQAMERGLYVVDEWLRFRGGESRAAFVVKGVLGLLWSAVTYLFRIYLNLLVEPQVNPIKHFPVVTVSHKIILPMSIPITRVFAAPLVPIFGEVVGTSIAAATTVLLPGVFGFLVWELKANWRLYGANRNRELQPSVVGHHSETVIKLMKPGFHSGTLPKLYRKLRRAERTARASALPALHRAAHDVEHAVASFAERELCALLEKLRAFEGAPVTVEGVELGSNRVRIALGCTALGERAFVLAFEEQSGWLVAGLAQHGWLRATSPAQREAVALALTGFYKLAGVDLVRAQLASLLGGLRTYDIADAGLVVWPGPGYERTVVYSLRARKEPVMPEADGPHSLPPLALSRLLYRRSPVRWADWVAALEAERRGATPAPLLSDVVVLPAA